MASKINTLSKAILSKWQIVAHKHLSNHSYIWHTLICQIKIITKVIKEQADILKKKNIYKVNQILNYMTKF